jgi:hypothetical protein
LRLCGPILKHYKAHGQTASSAHFCALLAEELKPTVHSKHRGMLTDELFTSWQCLTSYVYRNCWNNLETEVQASPQPSTQSRSHLIWLHYFQAI